RSAVVECIDIVGLERDRLVVARERLEQPAQLLQRGATVVVRRRGGGILPERRIDLADRFLVAAALMMDDAEQMQAVEMPGVRTQYLGVERLGLRQAAGLVEGQGLAEQRHDAGGDGGGRRRQAALPGQRRPWESWSESRSLF